MAQAASLLGEEEWIRWRIAPTDEFVGVWIPFQSCHGALTNQFG